MGSFLLVWFEGDVAKAFADLATNDSDFVTWFHGRFLDVTGVDLGAPSDQPPAVLFDWHAYPRHGRTTASGRHPKRDRPFPPATQSIDRATIGDLGSHVQVRPTFWLRHRLSCLVPSAC